MGLKCTISRRREVCFVELNPDCVRDILLDVERIDCPRANYRYPADSKVLIERYSADVVAYHIQQCIYSGFFVNPKSYMRGSLYIQSLSPKGTNLSATSARILSGTKLKLWHPKSDSNP